MGDEYAPAPKPGSEQRSGYGLQLALLLVAALLTGKALSDGQLSAPVGIALLVMISVILVWGAVRRAFTSDGDRR